MIQQTQDQWLDSKYIASSKDGGVPDPNYCEIAKAYKFKTFSISKNKDIHKVLAEVSEFDGPVFCEVNIMPEHRVVPQVKYGRPIEDSSPLLDRNNFNQQMIIPMMDISKKSDTS